MRALPPGLVHDELEKQPKQNVIVRETDRNGKDACRHVGRRQFHLQEHRTWHEVACSSEYRFGG